MKENSFCIFTRYFHFVLKLRMFKCFTKIAWDNKKKECSIRKDFNPFTMARIVNLSKIIRYLLLQNSDAFNFYPYDYNFSSFLPKKLLFVLHWAIFHFFKLPNKNITIFLDKILKFRPLCNITYKYSVEPSKLDNFSFFRFTLIFFATLLDNLQIKKKYSIRK